MNVKKISAIIARLSNTPATIGAVAFRHNHYRDLTFAVRLYQRKRGLTPSEPDFQHK